MTCYSWYLAAVPHLHNVLITHTNSLDQKFRWPNPLRRMHALGLLPFVEILWIRGDDDSDDDLGFSSKRFNRRVLRQFSALANVRRLMIDLLDILNFMPRIKRYFGHFLPTVQVLVLTQPRGTRRQITCFIGLFRHLEYLEIHHGVDFQGEPRDDLTLIPPFAPPLRGWLMMSDLTGVGLLEDMIDLFGGSPIQLPGTFQYGGDAASTGRLRGNIGNSGAVPDRSSRWAIFLENVQVLADYSTVRSSLQDFDLSRNKSLRTIKVIAACIDKTLIDGSLDTTMLLKQVLSTSTSPAYLDVVVVYRESDFGGINPRGYPDRPHLREMSEADTEEETLRYDRLFEVSREVHKVRDFQLVLCAQVWDPVGEYSVRMLKAAVVDERAKGGFDGFRFEPFVIYCPLRVRP